MNIRQITVGSFQANCLIVWGGGSEAIVVDPGADAGAIRAVIDQNGLSVAAYMLTHGHMDHVSAIAELHAALPAPVGISKFDLPWAFEESNQMPPFYPPPGRPATIERELADGQEWNDAGLAYRVIATPGHTPGSVCFHFPAENVLLTGDTLFAGSVGRTDLPGGDSRAMNESLGRLAALPEETTVYCGHGPKTTVAHERANNFFLQAHL